MFEMLFIHTRHIIEWQAQMLISPAVWLVAILSFALQMGVFTHIYKSKSVEFIRIEDFQMSAYEKEFLAKFGFYFIWALLQQCILMILVYSLEYNIGLSFLLSAFFFSVVYHLGNLRLMLFTLAFGLFHYFFWFFFDAQSLLVLAALHALGGTAYYKLGWDMRVWRFDS